MQIVAATFWDQVPNKKIRNEISATPRVSDLQNKMVSYHERVVQLFLFAAVRFSFTACIVPLSSAVDSCRLSN